MLKRISSAARRDIEKFMGTKVFLQTWVKVKENWRDNPNFIRSQGYKDVYKRQMRQMSDDTDRRVW